MIKTKRSTILLTLAALALAFISAALLFMVAPKRAAKADGTPVLYEWELKALNIHEGTTETLQSGDVLVNRYFLVGPDWSGSPIQLNGGKFQIVNVVGLEIIVGDLNQTGNSDGSVFNDGVAGYDVIYNDQNFKLIYFEYTFQSPEHEAAYISDYFTATENDPRVYILKSEPTFEENAPTEPEQPEDPGTEPEQPGENSGTETENKKFDIGEWLVNTGENVSTWLGDNVGIATTGSTVLIVGAILIIIVLARRRR